MAGSLTLLAADNGNLWDAGKVDSSQTIAIPYNGKPLKSRYVCYWKVRAWDAAVLRS